MGSTCLQFDYKSYKSHRTYFNNKVLTQFSNGVLITLSSILFIASFPPFHSGYLIFIAFVPIFRVLHQCSKISGLFYGLLFGFITYGGILWWIAPDIQRNGGISIWTAILLTALLCIYLSLYTAVFGFIAPIFFTKRGGLIGVAIVWVLLEYIRSHILTGFPWAISGVALANIKWTALACGASIYGIFGLSLFVLLTNGFIYTILFGWKRCFLHLRTYIILILAIGMCLISLVAYVDLQNLEVTGILNVGIVHPSIQQNEKWQVEKAEMIKGRLIHLTQNVLGSDLIVWPESSTPFHWGFGDNLEEALVNLIGGSKSYVLLGTILERENGSILNSAVLINNEGRLIGNYSKSHLVPFGEYIPWGLTMILPKHLVHEVGIFSRGKKGEIIHWAKTTLGVSICYEIIFPSEIRKQVINGAEILINITNDAWFEGTPGAEQHFLHARLRSIENGRFMIRCANGGYSAIVTPWGTSKSISPERVGTLKVRAPLIEDKTVYSDKGEWLLIFCTLALLVIWIIYLVK